LRLTAIGKIIKGTGVQVDTPDGRPLDLASGGYRHFKP